MKFGVLPADAPPLLVAARELGIDVVGISFHVGSDCMDPPAFRTAITAAKLLFSIGHDLGFRMNTLDIGGGFPGDSGTSITEVKNKLVQFFATRNNG